jgi:hypothetical protein
MRALKLILPMVALTVLVSLLSIWYYPSDHDFAISNHQWNGYSDFVSEFGVVPLDSLEELLELPENAALIAIPYRDYTAAEMEQLRLFVAAGGTLVVMDDYGYGNRLLEAFSMPERFAGTPLLDGLFCYNNQWLPQVTEFSSELAARGVDGLLTNHATALLNVPEENRLASFSSVSYLDQNLDSRFLESDDTIGPHPVAAVRQYVRGQVFMVADASLLINGMLYREDNLAFAHYMLERSADTALVALDRGHLEGQRLDVSKTKLAGIRRSLIDPYIMVGIAALMLIASATYALKKEDALD